MLSVLHPKRWITIPPIKTHFPKNHFKRHWIIFQTLFFTGHISFFSFFFFRRGKSGGPKPSVIGNRPIAANWQSLGSLMHVSAPQIIPFLGMFSLFPPIFGNGFIFLSLLLRLVKRLLRGLVFGMLRHGFRQLLEWWLHSWTLLPMATPNTSARQLPFLGLKKNGVGYG